MLMLKIKILLLLLITKLNMQIIYDQYISMQQEDQIYFSYIPLIESCNYGDNPQIDQGSVTITSMNPSNFFQIVVNQNKAIFWTPTPSGLSVSLLLSSNIPSQYDGYILYNSAIVFNNREIILYKISDTMDSILFDYTFVTMANSSLTLDFRSTRTHQITFSGNNTLFQTCADLGIQNNKTNPYKISFLQDNVYLYICTQNLQAFTFQSNQTNQTYTQIISLDESDIPSISQITSNPINLLASNVPFSNNTDNGLFTWNLLILSINPDQNYTYFCEFKLDSSNYSCSKYQELLTEIYVIVDRVWGQNYIQNQQKMMQIVSQAKFFTGKYNFPGPINQVFFSVSENIFIQSIQNNITYLNIFDDTEQHMANISYNGTIVYYGERNFMIFNQLSKQIQRIQIDRPIYQIPQPKQNQTKQRYINDTIYCSENTTVQLNYQIMWTSPYYPSFRVLEYSKNRSYSSVNQIFQVNIAEQFLVIGPAYNIYANTNDDMLSVIIDSSIIEIQNQFMAVVGLQILQSRIIRVLLATTAQILLVTKDNLIGRIVSSKPCNLQNIVKTQKISDDSYLIVSADNKVCLCQNQFRHCRIINQNQKVSMLATSPNKFSPKSLYTKYLDAYHQHQEQGTLYVSQQPLQIRKNIYTIYNDGFMISILTNNTVLLINLNSNKIVDTYTTNCRTFNDTQGSVYMKQFYDPMLLLFCSQAQFITQLLIRNGVLKFQRTFPLYGFKTRVNSKPIEIGLNYVFLQVDSTVNRHPPIQQCCILRMDPCQYTVSIIQEIIQARQLIFVSRIQHLDVALYNNSKITNSSSFIKVYYGNAWITLNYTNRPEVVSSNEFQTVFQSFYYNYGAVFTSYIQYNFTRLKLNVLPHTIPQIILYKNESIKGNSVYSNIFPIDYFAVEGPVFYSYFQKLNTQNTIQFEVYQQDILTKVKLLGEIGINFLEIIIPSNFDLPILNSDLNDLILLVATDQLFIYTIQQNQYSMREIDRFTLAQEDCTYQIYEQLSINVITMIGDCQAPNYNDNYPILKLSIINGNITLEQSSIYIEFQFMEMFTIIIPNNTAIVIGVIQGPVYSFTGRLCILYGEYIANLFVSTKYQFLVSYDAYGSWQYYVIMTLDGKKLQVFLMPQLTSNDTINSTFTLEYGNFTDQQLCSVLNIFKADRQTIQIILSCSTYYYQFQIDVESQTMAIVRKYVRFSQCDAEDTFKPEIIKTKEHTVGALIAICRQNDATLKLQSYETINTSIPVIYTGFIQIYTMNGPHLLENITYNPIRIVPVSSSLSYNIFKAYSTDTIGKFIYSPINGRLLQNNLAFTQNIAIRYQPLIKNYQMPQIKITLYNPYDNVSQVYQTISMASGQSKTILSKILFGVFILFNVITLFFIIYAILSMQLRKQGNLSKVRQSSVSVMGLDLRFSNNLKALRERLDSQPEIIKKKNSRPSQIQLFYIKSK